MHGSTDELDKILGKYKRTSDMFQEWCCGKTGMENLILKFMVFIM
jgi:hypothetical protein